jgi:hypothetical protein
MRTFVASLFALGLLAGAASSPANACSISYKRGKSPEEIKRRADVQKLKGTFRLTEVSGERFINEEGEERVRDAKLLGTIQSSSKKSWRTIQPPPSEMLHEMCGCDCWYHRPEGDATGTFWIKRVARKGRYELMLWEGEYLTTANMVEKKD